MILQVAAKDTALYTDQQLAALIKEKVLGIFPGIRDTYSVYVASTPGGHTWAHHSLPLPALHLVETGVLREKDPRIFVLGHLTSINNAEITKMFGYISSYTEVEKAQIRQAFTLKGILVLALAILRNRNSGC